MVQVNVAIMMAPVTFLGHITSQPVEAMARMQTDRVQCPHCQVPRPSLLLLLLLLLMLLLLRIQMLLQSGAVIQSHKIPGLKSLRSNLMLCYVAAALLDAVCVC